MSADPLTVHGLGGDLNLYAYVSGRALQATDPLGLESDVETATANAAAEVRAIKANIRELQAVRKNAMAESAPESLIKDIDKAIKGERDRQKHVLAQLAGVVRQAELKDRGAPTHDPNDRMSDEDLEQAVPIFGMFFKVPNEAHNNGVQVPQNAPRGLREIRQMNGGNAPMHASAEFTRVYGGTDAASMTATVVGGAGEFGTAIAPLAAGTRTTAAVVRGGMATRRAGNFTGVVQQTGDSNCGQACLTMLLRDRGTATTLDEVTHTVGHSGVTLPEELARAGSQMTPGGGWRGGTVARTGRNLGALNDSGSWAALLNLEGGGHWVVVDGVQAGSVGLRDPARGRQSVSVPFFLEMWGGGAVFNP